ncbi:MAG: tRNA lysidine(34) synthetase TilS [Clostridia bacterium]|nr:tRNA lysidine(34) synthetase TilS [Clostridia bacterium]
MFDKSLFKKGDVVAVALSGGKDSVCLAHALKKCEGELGITVKAINVEHGIRKERSVLDSAFVKDFCAKLNIELKCYAVNVLKYSEEEGLSVETAARVLRYQCFDNALIEGFCNKIATAHHAGDNAETVLMNIFRGSSVSGACGISKTANGGKIIRPILKLTAEDIIKYVSANNLNYVTDESNEDISYTRNFLRNEVIPLIESRFPCAKRAINRFSEIAFEENELLNGLCQKLIKGNSVKIVEDNEKPLFMRAALLVIKKMGVVKDFENSHLLAVYNLKNSQVGARVEIGETVVAYKSYDCIEFLPLNRNQPQEIAFKEGSFVFGDYIINIERVNANGTNVKQEGVWFIDGDKLPYNAIIRTKRPGDQIKTFGKVTKSLKKFLTDKKIPAHLSASLAVIACESDVYAVIGVDISCKVAVDEGTKSLLKISCSKI